MYRSVFPVLVFSLVVDTWASCLDLDLDFRCLVGFKNIFLKVAVWSAHATQDLSSWDSKTKLTVKNNCIIYVIFKEQINSS